MLQPKTGNPCHCRRGVERDNCPACEGTGQQIDFRPIRAAGVYYQLKAAGIPLDSHESDLYAKVTDESRKIVKASGLVCTMFISQIDGLPWFDIPFAYAPFWERRSGR